MLPKAHIITYGCQMNTQEAGVMAALLERAGYQMTEALDQASLVVVETCAIRETAEHKVYSLLGRLKQSRERGQDLKIAVCGCAVTPDAAHRLVRRHGVNVVLGPRRIARIADAVEASDHDPVVDIGEEWALSLEDGTAPDIRGLSAFVTVMQGCSNACTFCVVPSRRGPAQSRPVDVILAEIRNLERQGYKEVTLLGQNISYYGLDGLGGPRLIDLLQRVEDETEIPRVRFATSHPAYIDQRFIDGFARLDRVLPHIHLPVQSGSSRLLREMKRGYTAERYVEIVKALREARPGTSVTTDIITGFDGETESDHQSTLDLVREAQIDSAYVFAYSERKGTAAVEAPRNAAPSVPLDVRLARCGKVLEALSGVAMERRQAEVGSEVEVLVERPGSGRTRANVLARFPGEGVAIGQVVRGRVTEAAPYILTIAVHSPAS